MTQSFFEETLPLAGSILSVVLMGIALSFLVLRLVKLLMGKKDTLGSGQRGQVAPLRALLWVACIALLSRFALYLAAWGMACLEAGTAVSFSESFSDLWLKWDARHYLKIARQGYTTVGDDRLMLVFFPLYPWMIRAVNLLMGDWLRSGIFVALLFSVGASVMLYMLCYRLYSARTAKLAVAYFLLNPYSVFLAAPYSESLFLFLTLCALYAASRDRLGWAGIFGALSALTRMLGLVVCGVILLATLRKVCNRRCRDRGQKIVWGVFCAGVVGTGFLVYLLLNVHVTGAPFTFLTYQKENWYQEFGSFWASVHTTLEYLHSAWGTPDGLYTWLLQLLSMFYVFVLLIFSVRKVSIEHGAYSWAYLFIALAPTWLLSGSRYIFGMATLPLLQAQVSKSRAFHTTMLLLSGALLIFIVHGYCIVQEVL